MGRSAHPPLPPSLSPLAAAGWVPGTAITCTALPDGGDTVDFRIDHRADRVLGPLQDDEVDVEDMEPFPIACETRGSSSCLFADVRPTKPVFYYYHEGLHRVAAGVERFIATLQGTPAPPTAAAPAPRRAAAGKAPAATAAPATAGGYAATSLLAGVTDGERSAEMPATLCRKARTARFAVWWVDRGCANGAKGRSAYRLEGLSDRAKVIAGIKNQPDDWLEKPQPLAARWPADAHARQGEDSVRHRQTLCNDALESITGMLVSAWLRRHLEPLLAGQAEFLPVAIRSESGRAILHDDFFFVHPLIAIDALDPAAARARRQRDGRIDLSRTRTLAIDPAKVPAGTRIFQLVGYGSQLMIVGQEIIPALLALPVPGMLLLPPEAYRLDIVMDWHRPR